MKPYPIVHTDEAFQEYIDSTTDTEFADDINYAIGSMYNQIKQINPSIESKVLFKGSMIIIKRKLSETPINRISMEPLFANLLDLHDKILKKKR